MRTEGWRRRRTDIYLGRLFELCEPESKSSRETMSRLIYINTYIYVHTHISLQQKISLSQSL